MLTLMLNRKIMALCFVSLALTYQNCGAPVHTSITPPSHLEETTNTVCEEDLQTSFASTYRPLLNNSALCLQCHTEGGSAPVKFASQDLATAFRAFMQVGVDRVGQNAVSVNHAPGHTGPNNTEPFAEARQTWDVAHSVYQACLEEISPTHPTPTPSPSDADPSHALKMIDQVEPELYFSDGRTGTLTWDLSGDDAQPSQARFAAVFALNARVLHETVDGKTSAIGYAFSNPRLSLLTGEDEVEIEGIIITINGKQVAGIEPFLSARKKIRGIDTVTFHGDEVLVPMPSVSSGDKIGVAFGYMDHHARTDTPSRPPTPVVTPQNAFTRTQNVPVTISGDSTARRWCLTASPEVPTSTTDPCPGFVTTTTGNGWTSSRPANLDLDSVGRALQTGETVRFYLWVANADLRINSTPASSQVTFDTTPPAAPVLSSIQVTDTQIADIVGLQDSNEPVSWCVREGSVETNVQQSSNGCFSSTKPTFVALTGGGTRYIAVFARDRAGNITRSEVATTVNPYGRISFEQLTNPTYGSRALFATRCFSCHGSGASNQSSWDATSYAASVALKSTIHNRVANSSRPMPTTGLLPAKEQALIRLWINQTSTPVQQ